MATENTLHLFADWCVTRTLKQTRSKMTPRAARLISRARLAQRKYLNGKCPLESLVPLAWTLAMFPEDSYDTVAYNDEIGNMVLCATSFMMCGCDTPNISNLTYHAAKAVEAAGVRSFDEDKAILEAEYARCLSL